MFLPPNPKRSRLQTCHSFFVLAQFSVWADSGLSEGLPFFWIINRLLFYNQIMKFMSLS